MLKMARGEDVGDEFENMLDIGNNAYLVGGDALVAKRAKRTKEALLVFSFTSATDSTTCWTAETTRI